MTEVIADRWIFAHMPDDSDLLAAVGRVAIRHGYLDLMLKRTVKVLAGLEEGEADSVLQFESSSALRDLAKKIATRRFGKAATATLKLKALLAQCELATEERNKLVHRDWALDTLRGQIMLMSFFRGEHWPVPDSIELNKLAERIFQLAIMIGDSLGDAGVVGTALRELTAKESIRVLKAE